jgi:DNA-binding NarL/FixJ family response regulator
VSYGKPRGDLRTGLRAVDQGRPRAERPKNQSRPHVLIAARHGAISRGFRIALEASGFRVSEFPTARAVVDAALRTRPDVCLVDFRIAGGSGSVVEQITEGVPSARVVLLTDSVEETDLLGALKAGAAGSLPKDIEPRRLPIALRAILAGEPAVPRQQVYRLIEEIRRQQKRRRSVFASGQEVSLTRREMEVLEHLAEERTTAQIAKTLGTSTGTVRSHIHAVRQKLGVDPRTVAADILNGETLRESTLVDDLEPRWRSSVDGRGSRAGTAG